MLVGIGAAVIASLAYGTASVLQAHGAHPRATRSEGGRHAPPVPSVPSVPSVRSTVAAILTATFLAGLVLDALGFLGNLVAARVAPLFLVQPIVAANLVVTAVLAALVLRARLRRRDWVAVGAVVVALVLLGIAAGDEGHGGAGSAHWVVLAAGAVLCAGGVIGIRLARRRVPLVAGLVGGTLFGVMAVAVRLVDGVDPVDIGRLLSDPAAYAIVGSGVGGFYLFTVALQTGSVSAAAAAVVAGETVVPGVVGIVALGDSVRPGWGAVAVIAFTAAVVGGVAIAASPVVADVEAVG